MTSVPNQHAPLWKPSLTSHDSSLLQMPDTMFSLVLGAMLCHLGCAHPRTPLPDLKQIKSVFCHLHMPYGVEHMVVAHLTNTCWMPWFLKGEEVPVLIFCSILPLFCLPSQPLYRLLSMCVLHSKKPSVIDFNRQKKI